MDRQYLVEIMDEASGVCHKVWVISPNPDNMQAFIDEQNKLHKLPAGITYPTVVSIKEMGLRTIRLQLIDKIFPVLR